MKLKRRKESSSYARSHVRVSYGTITTIANVLELTVLQLAFQLFHRALSCYILYISYPVIYFILLYLYTVLSASLHWGGSYVTFQFRLKLASAFFDNPES